MKTLWEQISARMETAFERCGYDSSLAKVALSDRPDLCEYQCNGAMAAAKRYHKKPMDIACEAAGELRSLDSGDDCPMFSEISTAAPGFINLRVDPSFLAGIVNTMRKEEKFGLELPGHSETVIVDYGGANVAKPLHVGHLRSAVIGEAVRRMGSYLGYNMVGDVHLGDWGLQMGLIIEELRDRQPDLPYFDESYMGEYPEEPPFTIGELEEIYPAANARSKEDPDFKARAQEATYRLQNGYKPYMAIWRHIMKVSLEDLKKNYDNLDVHFDLWKGESDAEPYIPELIDVLQKKGLARESDGALVVDVAEEGDSKEYPPCIIRKSDGAALYATSDLATILEREKDFDPAAYIYITDKRQDLHFLQVFRVARMAGLVKEDTPMIHIGFGTMNGKDGKPFKTREGGVMRLEDLMKELDDKVYERIMENREIPPEEAALIARVVGLAALKYGDLSNQATKDYVFDIDRFCSFEGNTGPYILYTIVRIRSILRKYTEETGEEVPDKPILPAAEGQEKTLQLLLARFGDVLPEAFRDIAPHKVCQYIYELSNSFNSFYHDTPILSEKDTERRNSLLSLITLVKDVLLTCTDVLGFSAPERM